MFPTRTKWTPTLEAVNHIVSHPVSEESLDARPSLVYASTGVLQAEDSNIRVMLWASFAEIYNEQIFDHRCRRPERRDRRLRRAFSFVTATTDVRT